MKKTLLSFFVVFMLLAFVGCEKDKSDEVAQTYIEFLNTLKNLELITASGLEPGWSEPFNNSRENEVIWDEKHENWKWINEWKNDEDLVQHAFAALFYFGEVDSKVDVSKFKLKSVTGGNTYTGVEKENVGYMLEGGLVTDGSIVIELPNGEEKNLSIKEKIRVENSAYGSTTYVDEMIVNGRPYSPIVFETEYHENTDDRFVFASVDGKEVDIRLLNGIV